MVSSKCCFQSDPGKRVGGSKDGAGTDGAGTDGAGTAGMGKAEASMPAGRVGVRGCVEG